METKTLECGCVLQLNDRQGTAEGWRLFTECSTHQTQRESANQQGNLRDQKRIIVSQLEEIDRKSIRALRAGETQRLTDLENQAIALRAQLASLS